MHEGVLVTHLINDPARFAGEALAGFAAAHPKLVRLIPGAGVVRAADHAGVAVLMGGGSGHYPAFAGWVGPGIGSGAVAGNVFSSPSASQIVDVTVAAASGTDVMFVPINYSGDLLHFGEAARRLEAQGYDVRTVAVTDDIATPADGDGGGRRGIAGSFIVAKIVGAAAQRGDDLDSVERIARKAVAATRTLGVAFVGCTLPGASAPGVQIPGGVMTVGLGIHGEPGLESRPLETADSTADLLVDALFRERAPEAGGRVAVLVNGLGATTPDELYVVFARVEHRLREVGMTVVSPVVDELVTSLDMAGLSLSLTYLDDELAELWEAPARTVAFARGEIHTETDLWAPPASAHGSPHPPERGPGSYESVPARAASAESKKLAALISDRLGDVAETLTAHATQLGELDAVAGDGDHGACMQRGSTAALAAARTAVAAGAGAGSVLAAAGEAWSDVGGGTSGALWGAGLQAAAGVLTDDRAPSSALAIAAVDAFVATIVERGGAQVGDKTMVDALIPFAETLRERMDGPDSLITVWIAATDVARACAQNTATFTARRGRSRTHGEASIGTPDPGAVSFAAVAAAAERGSSGPTTEDHS
jgi:dihydroxyacetone kinase